MNRREFLQVLAAAGGGLSPLSARAEDSFYDIKPFGDVRILHTSDMHAQAMPIYFREPGVNLGASGSRGKMPHLVGEAMLKKYGIPSGGALAYALSYVGFDELAARYGKVGGLAHIASLCGQLRGEFGRERTLHLDSGDMLQGSAVALRNQGRDMVAAANLLEVDAMTGHWEFTYPEKTLRAVLAEFNGEFVAHNISATEDALFNGAEVLDEDTGRIFPPSAVFERGGRRIAVIGQAFPFTPIANPRRFIPDWTFGIRAAELRELVAELREKEKPDLVVLLSHNGMGLDLRMAQDLDNVNIILGGHTHDALPQLVTAAGGGGAAVINAGCSGKFVGCLDVGWDGARPIFRYRLLPVFSRQLPESAAMADLVRRYRAPHEKELSETLCVAGGALYRRGSFNGGMDQVIVDALREYYDAQIALSPGFRWGAALPAGSEVRMEDVWNATAMTYPETYVRSMPGSDIRAILEDVADNMFHPDPFYRQGGDMVRTGGIRYDLTPDAAAGKRIGSLRLASGEPIAPDKTYKVAGWATAGAVSPGPPIWEIVADYLRGKGNFHPGELELPTVRGRIGDPALGEHPLSLLK